MSEQKTKNDKIKFYKNWSDAKKVFFVSGKNEDGKYFSLWLNPDFQKDGEYLDNDKFSKGLAISKSDLKLLEQNKDCKVLVFRTEEKQKEFTITKEQIEEKKSKKKQEQNFDTIGAIKELIKAIDLQVEELEKFPILKSLVVEETKLEEVEDNGDLPF